MAGWIRRKGQGQASLQGKGLDGRLLMNPWFHETNNAGWYNQPAKNARYQAGPHEPIDQIFEQRFQVERLRKVHTLGLNARAH